MGTKAPVAVLVNSSDRELGYGPGFKLERKTAAGWRWVNRKQAFNLPLFFLRPHGRGKPEPIAVYIGKPRPRSLAPGLYRVTKGVNLDPNGGTAPPPTLDVSATFRVVPS